MPPEFHYSLLSQVATPLLFSPTASNFPQGSDLSLLFSPLLSLDLRVWNSNPNRDVEHLFLSSGTSYGPSQRRSDTGENLRLLMSASIVGFSRFALCIFLDGSRVRPNSSSQEQRSWHTLHSFFPSPRASSTIRLSGTFHIFSLLPFVLSLWFFPPKVLDFFFFYHGPPPPPGRDRTTTTDGDLRLFLAPKRLKSKEKILRRLSLPREFEGAALFAEYFRDVLFFILLCSRSSFGYYFFPFFFRLPSSR